jgi:hypothetical protein
MRGEQRGAGGAGWTAGTDALSGLRACDCTTAQGFSAAARSMYRDSGATTLRPGTDAAVRPRAMLHWVYHDSRTWKRPGVECSCALDALTRPLSTGDAGRFSSLRRAPQAAYAQTGNPRSKFAGVEGSCALHSVLTRPPPLASSPPRSFSLPAREPIRAPLPRPRVPPVAHGILPGSSCRGRPWVQAVAVINSSMWNH